MEILRSNKGKLPILVIIIAAVVVVAGLGIFMLKGKSKHKKEPVKVELKTWALDEFVVNLADADRYLKVDMVIEVEVNPEAEKAKKAGHGAEAEGEGEEKALSPEDIKARDTIITVLSSKHYNELQEENGKTKLKKELKEELQEALHGEVKISNIYFTSFVTQ